VGEVPVVRLDRGLRIEGRATTPEGKPLAGVRTIVGGQGGTTGEDGRYAITGLEPGPQKAAAEGDFVLEATRTVQVGAAGQDRVDWTLAPAGVLEVALGDAPSAGDAERVVVAPLAGGEPREQKSGVGVLRWGSAHHGARFPGLAPGRYRVEARQGETTHPAKEVDVKVGEVVTLRFP
jgi:hypothetical protein